MDTLISPISTETPQGGSGTATPRSSTGAFVPLVTVIGFHHARGPEVESWYGVSEGADPALDYGWSLLPFMALSDGAHAYVHPSTIQADISTMELWLTIWRKIGHLRTSPTLPFSDLQPRQSLRRRYSEYHVRDRWMQHYLSIDPPTLHARPFKKLWW